MSQNDSIFEIGLNIHLLSFSLPNDLIKDRDEVRVSITTMPDESKQHFSLHGKKMNCSNHVFSLNITNKTKHIIMVFRKKTFLSENPIIGSVTIHTKDFPKIPRSVDQLCSGIINTDVKKVNIYYPLQKQIKEFEQQSSVPQSEEEIKKQIKRKVLGQMQIQLSFTAPYSNVNTDKIKKEKSESKKNAEPKKNSKTEKSKIHKSKKPSKNGNYEKLSDENGYGNYSLL